MGYTALVEEKLGVPEFCRDNSCDEEALMESMKALVKEKPDVMMFFDSLVSTTDYDGFLKLAYSVKTNQHCFRPHLTTQCGVKRRRGHGPQRVPVELVS